MHPRNLPGQTGLVSLFCARVVQVHIQRALLTNGVHDGFGLGGEGVHTLLVGGRHFREERRERLDGSERSGVAGKSALRDLNITNADRKDVTLGAETRNGEYVKTDDYSHSKQQIAKGKRGRGKEKVRRGLPFPGRLELLELARAEVASGHLG